MSSLEEKVNSRTLGEIPTHNAHVIQAGAMTPVLATPAVLAGALTVQAFALGAGAGVAARNGYLR